MTREHDSDALVPPPEPFAEDDRSADGATPVPDLLPTEVSVSVSLIVTEVVVVAASDGNSSADEAELPPLCWRCGAVIRVTVRFCGQCGIPTRPHDFLAAPPAAPSRLGLGVALGTYFVLLATLIGMMLSEISSIRTVLFFDVAILAAGGVLIVAFWQELGGLLGAPTRLDRRTVGVSLAALAVVFGVVQGLAALFPTLFADVMDSYRAEGVGLGFAIFQIGPLTALGEELLFRGVILAGLRSTFPDRIAIAVSAAMFATIHLSPVAFLHTGGLGLLFGWLTVRTGSLWPSILLHAAWNTTMVLLDA